MSDQDIIVVQEDVVTLLDVSGDETTVVIQDNQTGVVEVVEQSAITVQDQIITMVSETEQVIAVIADAVQGPPGADALPYGKSKMVDPSRPIAYVGYASRILRLDYSSFPPVTKTCLVTDLEADWPNRAGLTYI